MDYSYFSATAQSYPPFVGLPPTPAHSYEQPDEQTTDPSENYQATNGFQGFEQAYRFDANPLYIPPQLQQHSPPDSKPSSMVGIGKPDISPGGIGGSGDYDNNDPNENRSSSEEKETLTPAQSRRKAQNRAAQRAFRERKERHVKDLESRLNTLSAHSSTLLSDNERLKRELQKLATQNEILRATTNNSHTQQRHAQRAPSPLPGPQTYSPVDFQVAVGVDPIAHPISYEDFGGEEGDRLLAAGATWDLIKNNEMCQKGMVDVGDVCRRLKGKTECDGRGPAFRESVIKRAIENSVVVGSDELI